MSEEEFVDEEDLEAEIESLEDEIVELEDEISYLENELEKVNEENKKLEKKNEELMNAIERIYWLVVDVSKLLREGEYSKIEEKINEIWDILEDFV